MKKPPLKPVPYVQPYRFASPNIPMSAIKRFARRIAEKFHPDKIILFGSYAYGTPHNESDVDLLVIMPCRNAIDQSIRIDAEFDREFSLDLIVRTPYQMRQGLKDPNDRDWFLYEITEKGKVLYEAPHRSMDSEGRRRHRSGTNSGPSAKPPRDAVGFHCQQSAEKYLKAMLQERGAAVPRIHDLKNLLELVLPHDATLKPLRRGLGTLTKYAVEYRYPGSRVSTRQMEAALRTAERVRADVRRRLGLAP